MSTMRVDRLFKVIQVSKNRVIGHAQQETPAYLDGYGGESRFHPSYGTWFELPKTGLIAMNTGCGFGGPLTAMIIENGWMRFESQMP